MCDFSLIPLPENSSVYTVLETFSAAFDTPHTYLSVIICILGTGCNLCNITVLTRRSMRTAVNTILCAIASCDTVVMLSNLVFISHYNLAATNHCTPENWSRNWGIFAYIHSQMALIGHSSSVWLSVMMGHLRYSTLRSSGGQMRSRKPNAEMNQAYVSIVLVLVVVTLFNIPNCLSYSIREIPIVHFCGPDWLTENSTFGYMPTLSDMATENQCLLFRLAFWISGILFKVIPCALLTIFIVVLLRILSEVKRRRARLMEGKKPTGKEENADRTTRMLITVICVFLATELPQGFMSVANGVFSQEFQRNIYQNLGDVLDMLSLINSCLTFVIYCTMSKQYRTEFERIFIPNKLRRSTSTSTKKSRKSRKQCQNVPTHLTGEGNNNNNNNNTNQHQQQRKGSNHSVLMHNNNSSSEFSTEENPSLMPLRKRLHAELRKNSIYRKLSTTKTAPPSLRPKSASFTDRKISTADAEKRNNNNNRKYSRFLKPNNVVILRNNNNNNEIMQAAAASDNGEKNLQDFIGVIGNNKYCQKAVKPSFMDHQPQKQQLNNPMEALLVRDKRSVLPLHHQIGDNNIIYEEDSSSTAAAAYCSLPPYRILTSSIYNADQQQQHQEHQQLTDQSTVISCSSSGQSSALVDGFFGGGKLSDDTVMDHNRHTSSTTDMDHNRHTPSTTVMDHNRHTPSMTTVMDHNQHTPSTTAGEKQQTVAEDILQLSGSNVDDPSSPAVVDDNAANWDNFSSTSKPSSDYQKIKAVSDDIFDLTMIESQKYSQAKNPASPAAVHLCNPKNIVGETVTCPEKPKKTLPSSPDRHHRINSNSNNNNLEFLKEVYSIQTTI